MPARLRNGLLLAVAALIAVVVIAFWSHGGSEPSVGKQTAPPSRGAEPLSAPEVSAASVSAQRSSMETCDGQTLELTLNGARSTPCFSSVSATQNGSVRSYQIQTANGPARSLRIDASGTIIVAAFLSTDSTPIFRCKGETCKGISIGKRDAEGVRTISLKQAVLSEAAGGSATLSGNIKTLPEDKLLNGLACDDQGLNMIATDGSTTTFCPKGGVGFEIGDDGNTTYRFTNLDNESLLVVVNPSHQVQRVAFEGESSYACQGGDCRQLQISDGRVFRFSGTSLIDTRSGESNTVLNGTLIVPPL